jgi:hypothetical protein
VGLTSLPAKRGSAEDELNSVLVLQEEAPSSVPKAKPQLPLGPISHLSYVPLRSRHGGTRI